MSVEEALSGFGVSKEETAVDVAKELFNKKNPVMHTRIKNTKMLIGLDVYRALAKQKGYDKSAEVMWMIKKGTILYPVSEGREGRKEIVRVLEAQMAMLGMQLAKGKNGGGLFGDNK